MICQKFGRKILIRWTTVDFFDQMKYPEVLGVSQSVGLSSEIKITFAILFFDLFTVGTHVRALAGLTFNREVTLFMCHMRN